VQVDRALERASAHSGVVSSFALLAPELSPPRYVLFVESSADDEGLSRLAAALERELMQSHHYRYCRDLGQLEALAFCRVKNGTQRMTDALVARGARLGDIKPTHLDGRTFWREALDCP
jgi:hypothetical protein